VSRDCGRRNLAFCARYRISRVILEHLVTNFRPFFWRHFSKYSCYFFYRVSSAVYHFLLLLEDSDGYHHSNNGQLLMPGASDRRNGALLTVEPHESVSVWSPTCTLQLNFGNRGDLSECLWCARLSLWIASPHGCVYLRLARRV